MRFPDRVTVLRATEADEYGNPGASWDEPAEWPAEAFVLGSKAKALLPPTAPVRDGDRIRYDGDTYDVTAVVAVRSPARTVLLSASITRLGGL